MQQLLRLKMAKPLLHIYPYEVIDILRSLTHKGGITTTSELAVGGIDPIMENGPYDKIFNDPLIPTRLVAIPEADDMVKFKVKENEANITPPTLFLAGFIMASNNNNFGIEHLTAIATEDY